MLVIKRKQMDAWSQDKVDRFIDGMEQHLKKRYPKETENVIDDAFRKLIFSGVQEAKEFDITDENDVKRYLEYLVEYGEDFGKSSDTQWAGQFLKNERLTGTAKMDEIDNHDLFIISLGKSV